MPRPKLKQELLDLSSKNQQKLLAYIDQLSLEQQERDFPPGTLNRNIRDVLAHLHQWHLMMLDWYAVGMQGQKPVMPADGYTWRDTGKLNQKIWDLYQAISLAQIRAEFERSAQRVQKLILAHTDEELFEKKRYQWTGSTSLGAYLISATSSHYDWAYKLIKNATK
ncbi:MAG: ClbS/DfsB family four-helix bundle protein [Bacteroidota bacterium]